MGTTPPYNPNDPRNDPRWQRQVLRDQIRANRAAWKMQARAQREQWRAQSRMYRRTSIVGPLLLVALGVLFLLGRAGRVPAFEVASWYAHWWPAVLIFLGVVMVAEWLITRALRPSDAPPVRYGLGAGAGILLFFLIISGIALTAVVDHRRGIGHLFNDEDWNHFLGSKVERELPPIVHALPAGGTLSIEDPHGDITVRGISDDGQMHLTVHNALYGFSGDDANSKLEQIKPQVTTEGSVTVIRAPSIDNSTSDLVLEVPAATPLTISSNHGEVNINGIKGAVAVTSNNGDVALKAITGPVTAHINNSHSSLTVSNVTGALSVEGRGNEINLSSIDGKVDVRADFFGGGHLQHITNAINIHSSKIDFSAARLDGTADIESKAEFNLDQALGPVIVDTHNRNIGISRVSGDLSVSNNNGDVTVTTALPLGAVKIDNRNGSVNLGLPTKAAFTVQADATDGEVHSDFTFASRTSSTPGSVSGTVGGGGHPIRVTTTHGDVSLTRSEAFPIPPKPPVPTLSIETDNLDVKHSVEDAKQELRRAQEKVRQAEHDAREEARRAQDNVREKERALRDAARDEARRKAQDHNY